MSHDQVKYDVAIANRVLAHIGLATGVLASLGHASMRVPDAPDRFVVKGRGYEVDILGEMRPEDMIVCDLDGYKVEGPKGTAQCNEVKMHSCIYKLHPEVQSVVHVHPRYIVAMSLLRPYLVPVCQEGIQLVTEPLPVYPHVKTVQSDDEGMEVANLIGDHKAIILYGHGAATTGKSLNESVMNMYQLEEQARMNWIQYCAAGPDYPRIPAELVAEMRGRPALEELPHLRESRADVVQRPGAVYAYYASVVAKDL